MLKKQSLFLLCFIVSYTLYSQTVHFDVSRIRFSDLLDYTITDAKELFKQSKLTVSDLSDSTVNWKIVFQLDKDTAIYKTLYDSYKKENQQFSIQSDKQDQLYIITIRSLSEKGLSNGLYYWMQNYLGFQFYHPKQTIIPDLSAYVPDTVNITVAPRFDKIGFHIHSMHPLEITEALLDENTPNGQVEVKTYINWLCRNGQNFFEFYLLRSVDLPKWTDYFKPIVDYAHNRGVLCGVEMSLHMIQQRSFQLYKTFPSSFKKKDLQITNNITQLMKVKWDLWNVEFTSTEFSQKDQQKLYQQKKFLYDSLEKYHVKLMSNKHVVKEENMVSGAKSVNFSRTDMDSAYGAFVHSVMFYSLLDSSAPVYRNKDFSHIVKLLKDSKTYRETYYFPESAYWITFDNSVPMFLTPYLKARLDDINFCDTLGGVDGHVTFTSGWEWNYWLIDWSIARWCWKQEGKPLSNDPLEYYNDISKDQAMQDFTKEVNQLQSRWIKGKELIKVMDAQTITDEIGGKINLEFHPRPEYPYKYIMNKATKPELDFIRQKYVTGLDSFIQQYHAIRSRYTFNNSNTITSEMLRSLDIVALRAEHRKNTLLYLLGYRSNMINHTSEPIQLYLEKAKICREKALLLVTQQQAGYRYPVSSIAAEKPSKTVYDFGYLYTVSNLHFWEREELQAKNNKWKFWYQNIWDVMKIIGVKK